jgi:hypothetical protein
MKRLLLVASLLAALTVVPPVFGGLSMGSPSKWDNIQVGLTYRLYQPKVKLRLKQKSVKTVSCGTGKEPWVAGAYGTNKRGFSIYEGHPICSDPGESTRIGNPRIMGVKAYLGVYCDPTQKCTKAQGVKNGFLLTWNAKPSRPYKKNTTIQLNSMHLTLSDLMKVVRGLRKV